MWSTSASKGSLLTGAFVAVVLSSAFGTWAGVLGAMAIAALLGAFLAWLAIRFQVDQIVAGVVINILAVGLTSFLASRLLSEAQDLNAPARVPSIRIPVLADIPVIGPMFFDHTFFVYVTFLLVFGLHYGLFRTRWGLRARSVGEHPKAADTLGIDVFKVRYRNVIGAGLIAGFGGAFLALAQISRFEENMTGGIGFIGLAAMIFGRWMPFGALAAGLLFGFSGALAQKVGDPGHGHPVGVHADAALCGDRDRRRRSGGTGPSAGRRWPALHQAVALSRQWSSRSPGTVVPVVPAGAVVPVVGVTGTTHDHDLHDGELVEHVVVHHLRQIGVDHVDLEGRGVQGGVANHLGPLLVLEGRPAPRPGSPGRGSSGSSPGSSAGTGWRPRYWSTGSR